MGSRGVFWPAVMAAVLVTPSGALSPGPLSASAVAAGAGLGVLGGVLVALGHLAVELPYFLVLRRLLGVVEVRLAGFRVFLDVVAAGFMGFFGFLLVRAGLGYLRGGFSGGGSGVIGDPVLAFLSGVFLTGFNAYFLAWWVTVGKPIVDGASRLPLAGSLVVYGVHYSYDLGWLAFLAWLGSAGSWLGPGVMAGLMFVLAVVLFYYMVRILLQIPWRRGSSRVLGVEPEEG